MSDYYERLAGGWDLAETVCNIGWWQDGHLRSLVEHPRVVPSVRPRVDGQRCVEVCSGRGGNLAVLTAMGASHVTGLDRSPAQLAAAGAVAGAGRTLVRADALALPVAPGTADLVLCVEALGHVEDLVRFLDESAATLRPGGSLVLVELLADPVWELVEAVAGEIGLPLAVQEDLTDVVLESMVGWGGRAHPFGPVFAYLGRREGRWSYRLAVFDRLEGVRPERSRHRTRLQAVSRWGARRTDQLLREDGAS